MACDDSGSGVVLVDVYFSSLISLSSFQELFEGLIHLTNKPVLEVFKSLIFHYSNDDKKISGYNQKDDNKANNVQHYCFRVTMILGVVGRHGAQS